MDRREFAVGVSASLAAVKLGLARNRQQSGSPAPSANGRPQPVQLAEGLTVTDYRFGLHGVGLPNLHQAFVEITSPSNAILWSPLRVLMTIIDRDGNIVWEDNASTQVGMVGGGYSDFLFSQFTSDDFDPENDAWHSVSFSLDEQLGWDKSHADYDPNAYVIEDLEEERGNDTWVGEGMVRNTTDSPVSGLQLFTVFREPNGRYAGLARDIIESEIPAGKSARFRIEVGGNTLIPQDPFQFITGTEYEAIIIAK